VPRETEKIIKLMHRYLEEHAPENATEEEMRRLMDEFVSEYNKDPDAYLNRLEETADDYLEKAYNARSRKDKLKNAQKALELEPNNCDAMKMMIDLTCASENSRLEGFEQALAKADAWLKKEGYLPENMGHFWGVPETRPYMRLKRAYIDELLDYDMYGKAMSECERMVELSENDNLGVRYQLMGLYCFLDREREALKLHKKYGHLEETQMLLPLCVLYYNKRKLSKAKNYLERLCKANPDTEEFLDAIVQRRIDKYTENHNSDVYRPGSAEELVMTFDENLFLYGNARTFYAWANAVLNESGTKEKEQ